MAWRRSLVCAVSAGSVLGFGCGNASAPTATAAPAGEEPGQAATVQPEPALGDGGAAASSWDLEQELEDVTYRETKGTILQWELHADRVVQRAGAPAKLHVVTLRYYNGSNDAVVITADEADYDTEDQNAVLQGSVRVTGTNGDVLESNELVWNAETQRVSTESAVVLRRGTSHIEGTGLDTSPGLEDARIFNVSGIIREQELRG